MNGDAPVNVRTREAVESAIGQLGYVPSSAARTMRSRRTGLVGLVTGAISGPQAAGAASGLPDLQIVQGIQWVLAERDVTLLISDTSRADRVPQLVRTLREHRVEGLFYVAGHHQRIADAIRRGKIVCEHLDMDLFEYDFHAVAHLPVEEVRVMFTLPPKSAAACASGSASLFDPEGMSEVQRRYAASRRGEA